MYKTKLTGLFLIACLLAPIAFTAVGYLHVRHLVRKQVKQKMMTTTDRNQLVTLSFRVSESKKILKWKHAGEFVFRGKMFDVVETCITGDSIFYTCWPDEEETALNQKLNHLVMEAMGHNPLQQQNREKIVDFLKSLFPPDHIPTLFGLEPSRNMTVVAIKKMITRSVSIELPPPRFNIIDERCFDASYS